jgi:hypothetical protein
VIGEQPNEEERDVNVRLQRYLDNQAKRDTDGQSDVKAKKDGPASTATVSAATESGFSPVETMERVVSGWIEHAAARRLFLCARRAAHSRSCRPTPPHPLQHALPGLEVWNECD